MQLQPAIESLDCLPMMSVCPYLLSCLWLAWLSWLQELSWLHDLSWLQEPYGAHKDVGGATEQSKLFTNGCKSQLSAHQQRNKRLASHFLFTERDVDVVWLTAIGIAAPDR